MTVIVILSAMSTEVTALSFLYLLFTILIFYLFEKSLNHLPNGIVRSNRVSLKILIVISFAIALLPISWILSLYLTIVDLRFVGLFVLLSVVLLGSALLEVALRSAGNEPDLEIDLFETSFEHWSTIESHQNKKYITPDFHKEYKSHYRNFKPRNIGQYLVPTGSRTGSIIVVDNFRLTVGNPKTFGSTVHILGGSTTFCAETPNNLTFASILQAKFNAQFKDVRILNYGFSGATLPKLVERIELSDVRTEDLIVAYVGVNESAHLMVAEKSEVLSPFRLIPRFDEIVTVFARKSLVLEWLKNVTIARKWEILDSGVSEVEKSVDQLIEFSEKMGIPLLLVLQPNLFTKKTHSKYELELLEKMSEQFRSCMNLSYKKIETMLLVKKSPELIFRSAVSLMDEIENSPYLDTFHVNDEGNQAIADLIFKCLQKQIPY